MRNATTMAACAVALAGCATSEVDLSRQALPLDAEQWSQRIAQNYPSRALREEQEGTVRVEVKISPIGRVTACRVTASSGFPILDDAACRGAERYARFEPALDRNGEPTEGNWFMSIVYAID